MKDLRVGYLYNIFLPYKQVFTFMVSIKVVYKLRGVEYYLLIILIDNDN